MQIHGGDDYLAVPGSSGRLSRAFFISLGIHIGVALLLVGTGLFLRTQPKSMPIAFEFVAQTLGEVAEGQDIKAKGDTPEPQPPKPPKADPPPPPEPPKAEPPPPPEPPKPEPPKPKPEVKKPEPKPEVKKPEPKPEVKKPDIAKPVDKKKPEKPVKKKEDPKKKDDSKKAKDSKKDAKVPPIEVPDAWQPPSTTQKQGGKQGVEAEGPIRTGPNGELGLPSVLSGWAHLVQIKVEKFWQPPTGLRVGAGNQVMVLFMVDRLGNLTEEPEIVEPCGDVELAESGIKAIKQALPLPGLPDEFREAEVQVAYVFSLDKLQ